MSATRLAIAGVAMVLAGLSGAPSALTLAADDGFAHGIVDVSKTPTLAEGEEFLAPSPTNPRDILLGSNQWQPLTSQGTGLESLGPSGFTTCALYNSHDGGQTWRGRQLGQAGLGTTPVPAPSPELPGVGTVNWEFQDPGSVLGADQYPAWDRHGHAYYECLYFGEKTVGVGSGLEQIWFFTSNDHGDSWSAPQVLQDEVSSNTHADRGYIAVDNTGGPHDGTVYLSWESIVFQPITPHVYLRVGTPRAGGGLDWTAIKQVDDAAHQPMWSARQVTQVAPDGTLQVMFNSTGFVTPAEFDPQATPIQLVLATSHDQGRSFTYSTIESNVHRVSSPDEAFYYFTEMVGAFAVSPTDPRRMAAAWPDLGDGAPNPVVCGPPSPLCNSRILLRTSIDGGKTWSPRVDVADDPAGTQNQHDHATLSYLPDGRLLVAWRDRRAASGQWTDPWEVFLRVGEPTPTGYAFGPSLRLTTAPQAPTTDHHGTMPTEYMSVSGDVSGIHASWDQLDTSGNYPDNVYRHLSAAELAAPSAPTAPAPGGGSGMPNTGTTGAAAVLPVLPLLAAAGAAGWAARRRRRAAA